jgi:hypothetical protein
MNQLILDNGGGVTLQLGMWSHHYQDESQVITDLQEWFRTGSTDGWEGHEDDALSLDPTDEEIRNGGYRIFNLDDYDSIYGGLAGDLIRLGWRNSDQLAVAILGVEDIFNQTDTKGVIELRDGIYIQTNEYIIESQKSWSDGDDYKNEDFTTSPYWITVDTGSEPVGIDNLREVLLILR